MRIAVVAPSSRFEDWKAVRDRVRALAAARQPGLDVHFHAQCGLVSGHFAGTDAQRADVLVEVANDPTFDAIWFARGGYGSNRIAEAALARFGPAARDKAWLGYSDAGFLLAGLHRAGFSNVAHGPMRGTSPARARGGGRTRARLARRARAERAGAGTRSGQSHAAFNLTVLGMLSAPLWSRISPITFC